MSAVLIVTLVNTFLSKTKLILITMDKYGLNYNMNDLLPQYSSLLITLFQLSCYKKA